MVDKRGTGECWLLIGQFIVILSSVFGQLTRERGLWGPQTESKLFKWQLDNTEGPSRMRKRLIRDEMFYYR